MKKVNNSKHLKGKVRKGFKAYVYAVLCITMLVIFSVTAFAAGDPVGVVNNLSHSSSDLSEPSVLYCSASVLFRSDFL